MKKYALAIFLVGITCLPAAAQPIPVDAWLGIRGTEAEVLAQVTRLAAGEDWAVTYGEYCSRRRGNVVDSCRGIQVYIDDNEEIDYVFFKDSLFRITLFTQQVDWKDTAEWLLFCNKYKFTLVDFYIDDGRYTNNNEYKIIAAHKYYDEIICALEAPQYSWIHQQQKKESRIVTTDFMWHNNWLAPLSFFENCGCFYEVPDE